MKKVWTWFVLFTAVVDYVLECLFWPHFVGGSAHVLFVVITQSVHCGGLCCEVANTMKYKQVYKVIFVQTRSGTDTEIEWLVAADGVEDAMDKAKSNAKNFTRFVSVIATGTWVNL
jgi:hypothetical protein